MLNNISSMITPEIYELIYRMGHLDELVIVDANYSASAMSGRIVYSGVQESHMLLGEILKYFPLDEDEEFPATTMSLDYGIYEERFFRSVPDAARRKISPDYYEKNVSNKQHLADNARCLLFSVMLLDGRTFTSPLV